MELFKNFEVKDFEFATKTVPMTSLMLAQDMGSTETRTIVFSMEGDISDVVRMDSNFAVVNRDISHILTRNKDLMSQLEMILHNKSADQQTDPIFKDLHIVKGPLAQTVSTFTSRTTANSSKIDQLATYANSIANIAINILLASVNLGGLPDHTLDIDLTMALPPEDTIAPVRLELFSQRMHGVYEVEFPRLGCSVSFEIKPENIHVFSESNAVAVAQQATAPFEPEDTVGFIDVGGRSTGFSFVHGGVLLEDGCVTEGIGGQKLKELISRRVSNMLNTQTPSDDVILRSLSTGKIRLGAQSMNIGPCINEAKEEVAEQIFNGFMLAVDRNGLQAQQISKVYCSGRSFGVSKDGDYITSDSMCTNLERMFKERSPYTEFALVDVNDPIVTGLVYARFTLV